MPGVREGSPGRRVHGLARFAFIRLDPLGLVDMVTNPHMVE
jgi:hypothetical protein